MVSLLNDLGEPVFNGVGQTGIKSKTNPFLIAWAARSHFVFYCFPFFIFLSISWYCEALVVRLNWCISLSPSLALLTFNYNDCNFNNHYNYNYNYNDYNYNDCIFNFLIIMIVSFHIRLLFLSQGCKFGLRFEDQLPDITWNHTATSLANNSISLTLYNFISVDYTFDTNVSSTIVSPLL